MKTCIFYLQILKILDLSLDINEAHKFEWTLTSPKGTGNNVHPLVTASFVIPLIISFAFMKE